MRKISGILAAAALLASVAVVAPAANASETITGSGSTYMNPFQQTCSALYTANSVNYTGTGSSTGRSQFTAGTTDFGGSDDAFKSTEKQPASFVHVPLVAGPIVIAYNIPGVKSLRLDAKTIGGIFDGTIKTWDNSAIKKLNPTAKLPTQNIQVVYRSDGSGTTGNFSNYLLQTVGGSWTSNGTWATALGKTPVGVSASGNTGVTSTVKSTQYSVTYTEPSDAIKNGLPMAIVKNAAGQFVAPSVSTASKSIGAQPIDAKGIVTFDYKKKVSGAYPINLIAYGLARTADNKSAAKAAAVKDYFTYILNTCGPQRAAATNYVPITGKLRTTALQLVAGIK